MAKHSLRVGQKVVVKSNCCGSGYLIGKEYTIGNINASVDEQYSLVGHGCMNHFWVGLANLDTTSRRFLEIQHKLLQDELNEVEAKLAFLKLTHSDEYDYNVYRIWSAIKLVSNSHMTDLEKAQELAKVLAPL